MAVAGTATSWRTRSVPNSFNFIEISKSANDFSLTRFDLSTEFRFKANMKNLFNRDKTGNWREIK